MNPSDGQFCSMCAFPLSGNFVPPVHPPVAAAYPRPGTNFGPQSGVIQVAPGTHPVALVIILSILLGGWVGMLINRQYAKGLVFGLVVFMGVGALTCGLSLAVAYPLMLVDAILVATKLNRGEPVREWQWF